MIEIQKNYKITLDEEQARLLYHILDVTDNDKFSNNIKKTPLGRGDNTIEGETKIINPLKK